MKFIRASVTLLAFMIAALAFTATAHAAYTPTLSSPSNNAEFQAADNLDCSWTAGSDTPDHYIVTWALDSAMTDVLFEYETTDTSYSISGLPGLKTVYWQVTAVDAQDNEYPSSVWSFGTTTDGEESAGEETVFKLDFEDRSYEPDGWTASGPDWRTWSYNNNVHLLRYIWYYDRNENSYLTQNSSFVCGPDAELTYKWAHYNYSSSYRETLRIQVSTNNGSSWTTLYDHYAQNNYRYWPGGSTSYYPYSWKTQTVDFSDYAGQSIRLRFWVYTSSNSYSSWMMDDFTFKQAKGYEGTKREVTLTSDYSDPVPGSSVEAVYGNPVTVNVGSQFYSPAGMPEVRYVYDHFTGTGSFPVYGESASVTKKVFRTSTVTFEWIKQYKFTVYSPDDRGDPDPNGLVWADQGAEMTFEVQQPTVAGVVPGTRWLCSGWEGTGNFPPDGIVPSVTVESVSISSTLTWLWKIQYRLTIINPPGPGIGEVDPPAGEYWYDEGGTQEVQSNSFHDVGDGTAWKLLGWEGTGSVQNSELSSGTVTITQPSTLTWQWQRHYFLYITSEYGQVTGDGPGWYATGTELQCGTYTPYVVSDTVRYDCKGWTGTGSLSDGSGTDTGTFNITDRTEIVWNWQRQFLVTFEANYGSVNPSSAWVDEGATVSATAVAPTETAVSRFQWNTWLDPLGNPIGGSDPTHTFTVNGVETYTAMWAAEFFVEVFVRDDEGTLAMDYDGWYEKFETIDIVSMPPAANSGERFVPGWEGTGEGSVTYDALPATPSGVQIEVLAPIVQEVFWVIQYEFTIENPRGFGTPIPASGSYWFFDGERPEGRIDFYSGTHICTGFVGTGSVANGDTPYFRFVIHEPSSVEWLWDTPPVTPDESWTTAQSVTSGINGRTVAMKRQSDGSPFILFHEPVFGTIEAAYWHDDSWVTETVDTVGSGNLSAALMLDRFDVPFACYRRPATDEFVFATRDAAGWITQVIDSGDGVGMYSSMDIAEDGTILISYYVADTGELRIANSPAMHVKADHASDIEWTIQTVDDTGNVGLFCKVESIPFWGGVRIAYYNSTEAAVQVATLEPGAPGWTIERVTEDGYDMGINTAFGLDPAGKAILVFQNNTVSVNDQGLVFGRELPEGWQVYSLDEEGITGFDAVLVVDSYGYPHVAYNNFGTLLYARFNGEGWTITEIDSGDVGFGISLSLDEDDNAAITYWNNGSLYYVDVADNHFEGKIVNRYTQTSLVDDSTETGGGGGGGCFVATAAFGSMATSSVSALCSVRDSALAGSAQGTRLVGLYYAASPSVAVEMGSSDAVRVLVRRLLGN